jgi:hypothetical protein
MDVRITDVSMVPLTYTDLDRAVGYTMTVFIAVTVTDLQNEKTLMEDRPFQSTGTFILNYNPATAQSGSVADHLSEQVLSNLIEGW